MITQVKRYSRFLYIFEVSSYFGYALSSILSLQIEWSYIYSISWRSHYVIRDKWWKKVSYFLMYWFIIHLGLGIFLWAMLVYVSEQRFIYLFINFLRWRWRYDVFVSCNWMNIVVGLEFLFFPKIKISKNQVGLICSKFVRFIWFGHLILGSCLF